MERTTSCTRRIAPPRRFWAVLAITLVAAFLRMAWPGLTEFKFSEARLEALALELTQNGRLPLVGVPSSAGFDHSPLSVYVYVPPFLLGANPIPATIYGGMLNVLAVALCARVARRWPGGGWTAATVAALLLAVSPWSVVASRKIWQVALVPILTLAFVDCVVSALVLGRKWHLCWAGVLLAVLVQVHPSAVSLAPALAVCLVVFGRKAHGWPLVGGAALGALSAAPWLAWQLQSGWPILHSVRGLAAAQVDWQAVCLSWDAITGRGLQALAGRAAPSLEIAPQLGGAFGLVGWLTVASVLIVSWRWLRSQRHPGALHRERSGVDLVVLGWLLVPAALNLQHSLELHLHFFVLVVPAACLLVGRALQYVSEDWLCARRSPLRAAPRAAAWCGLCLLAAAQATGLVLLGHFVGQHDTAGGFGTPLREYLSVADRVEARARQTGALEVLLVGEGDSPVVHEGPAVFDVLLRNRAAVRFVDGRTTALFPAHPALAVLAPGANVAGEWYEGWPATALAHGLVMVSLPGSYPQGGLEQIDGPRLFQNGVELQAYAWRNAGVGEGGRLALRWQVLWRDPAEAHFSVRLLAEDGSVLAQVDMPGYPAAYRRKGDRLMTVVDITPGGVLGLKAEKAWVGQYLYPAVVDLPVVDSAGRPVLGAVVFSLDEQGN